MSQVSRKRPEFLPTIREGEVATFLLEKRNYDRLRRDTPSQLLQYATALTELSVIQAFDDRVLLDGVSPVFDALKTAQAKLDKHAVMSDHPIRLATVIESLVIAFLDTVAQFIPSAQAVCDANLASIGDRLPTYLPSLWQDTQPLRDTMTAVAEQMQSCVIPERIITRFSEDIQEIQAVLADLSSIEGRLLRQAISLHQLAHQLANQDTRMRQERPVQTQLRRLLSSSPTIQAQQQCISQLFRCIRFNIAQVAIVKSDLNHLLTILATLTQAESVRDMNTPMRPLFEGLLQALTDLLGHSTTLPDDVLNQVIIAHTIIANLTARPLTRYDFL